jgi:hypothetical protein
MWQIQESRNAEGCRKYYLQNTTTTIDWCKEAISFKYYSNEVRIELMVDSEFCLEKFD